jgi:hypothetical protein
MIIMNTLTRDFAKAFKKSYTCKMGGVQTIIFPNGQKFVFDDREYYSGRGVKYNSSIRHDNFEVVVTIKELKTRITLEKERQKRYKENEKLQKAYNKRTAEALKSGIYLIENGYVALTGDEKGNCIFDAKRLAKTLKISIKDAELLNSEGKTYVFAKSEDGNTYELFHPSLDCNPLSIHVSVSSTERMFQFDHAKWASAPYAELVGQTENTNHFVC